MKNVPWAGMLITVGILAAGCGASTASTVSSSAPAAGGSASSAATEPAASGPGTSGSSLSACRSADLRASLGGGAGPGMSQDHTGLQLRNAGSSACTLYGYPGVSWVAGANGHQVGAAASREPDSTGTAEKVITLAPGALASAPLNIVQAAVLPKSECQPVPVRGLRVYPPGERAALFIPMPGGSGQYEGCSLVTAQSTLMIGYLQPGAQPGGGNQG